MMQLKLRGGKMPELVHDLRQFLYGKSNCNIVYLYNKEDDMYYTIDECRIDSEGDVVLDISLSEV